MLRCGLNCFDICTIDRAPLRRGTSKVENRNPAGLSDGRRGFSLGRLSTAGQPGPLAWVETIDARLVPRFRSSHHFAARSFGNFGIEGH